MGLYAIVTHVNSHKLRLWERAKLASLVPTRAVHSSSIALKICTFLAELA